MKRVITPSFWTRIPYKSAVNRESDEKVTEKQVIIAKVCSAATLPPGPRFLPESVIKVTKSDGIKVKLEHFLDGPGPFCPIQASRSLGS